MMKMEGMEAMLNLATIMVMKKIMNLDQSPPSLKQRHLLLRKSPWCPHRTAWRVQARVGEEVALDSPPNRRAFRIPMATCQPPQPHLWWHPRRQQKRQARRPRRSRRTSTSSSRTKIYLTWTFLQQMEPTTAPTAPMVPTAPSLLRQRLDNSRHPKPQESRQATKKKGSMDTNTEVIGIEIGTRRVAKERKEGTGTGTRKARPRRAGKGGNIDTGRKRMPSLAIVNILGSKLMMS